MFYIKPALNSYTTCGIVEELGFGQMNYTTTLNPTATPNNETNRGDLDGFVLDAKTGDPDAVITNGIAQDTVYALSVGHTDGQEDNNFRVFIGFDISGIQSTVVSAKLKVYQAGGSG